MYKYMEYHVNVTKVLSFKGLETSVTVFVKLKCLYFNDFFLHNLFLRFVNAPEIMKKVVIEGKPRLLDYRSRISVYLVDFGTFD